MLGVYVSRKNPGREPQNPQQTGQRRAPDLPGPASPACGCLSLLIFIMGAGIPGWEGVLVWSGAGHQARDVAWETMAPSHPVEVHVVKAPGAGLTHFTVLGAQALGSTWCREATCSQQEDKFNPQSLGFPTWKWQNATNSSVCRGLMHMVGEGPSWYPVNVTSPGPSSHQAVNV